MQGNEKTTFNVLKSNTDDCFSLFYERYGARLHYYGCKMMRLDSDECWDLVYKTLYKVKDSVSNKTFESEKKFSSFVLTCFINYGKNYFRDTKKIREAVQLAYFNDAQFEEEYSSTNSVSREVKTKFALEYDGPENKESYNVTIVKEELEKLEDWERILLLLRAQNLPYSEIEKFVHKPASSLKVYYQRLKKKLQNRLNDKIIIDNL